VTAELTGTSHAVHGVVTGVISLKGRSPKNVEEKIPPLVRTIEAEQQELRQFDAELEKTSLT
jgi:hypothetical protein